MENKFDMNDMLAQFAQIRKMGVAGAMLSMMPGMSGIDASQIDEKAFDRIEAMIYSMTQAEREDPSLIHPTRTRRIAAGSGTQVSDVNKLLKQFEMCIRDSCRWWANRPVRRSSPCPAQSRLPSPKRHWRCV